MLIRSLLTAAEVVEDGEARDVCSCERRLANKLTACGATPMACIRESGRVTVSHGRCNSRMCPTCARHRKRDLEARVRRAVEVVDDARFLTLTLRSTSRPLGEQVERLKKCFGKLRRSKEWRQHVRGGVVVVEVTYNHRTDSWHPHVHCVIDGVFWSQRAVSAAWKAVTGDSSVVHITRVPSRVALTKYITKYVAKGVDLERAPDRRIAEWCMAMHGVRVAQAFGHLHGRMGKVEDGESHGPVVEQVPMMPLHDAAVAGDMRARRLWRCLHLAGRCDDHPANRGERIVIRHKHLARHLRCWWDEWRAEVNSRGQPPPKKQRSTLVRGPCLPGLENCCETRKNALTEGTKR